MKRMIFAGLLLTLCACVPNQPADPPATPGITLEGKVEIGISG